MRWDTQDNQYELTEDDKVKINTYHLAGYQILNQSFDLDPSVKRNATLICKEMYDLSEVDDVAYTKRIPELEILKVAAVFDNMTAMKYEEEPLSEIAALRYLLDENNGFDQEVVQALVDSINILVPGVCVELSNGERGLVITEGAINVLQPFVLSFKDNRIINLSEDAVAAEMHVVDIMKTMDNRHVVAADMFQSYIGEPVQIGKPNKKKHY